MNNPGIKYDKIHIIIVAITNPHAIAIIALENFISNNDAIRDPVHAPVPGRGIPTNNSNPINSYFCIFSLLPIDFFSNFSTIGLNNLVFFRQLKIGVIIHSLILCFCVKTPRWHA